MSGKSNSKYPQIPVVFTLLSETDLTELIENAVRKVMSEHPSNTANTLNHDELLTRKEASKEFKISLATLDNYRRDGRILPRRLGATVRYKRSDLQAAFSGNILNPYKVVKPKGKR